MEETLRDRIFHILKMTKDDPLLAADRVIAAMFDHLESRGCEAWLNEDDRELLLRFLAAARKEARK